MNKLEKRYSDRLEMLKMSGKIIDWKYEAIKFMLADRTSYSPDFLVITADEMQLHETKGFLRDDAAVKFKTAAAMFPWFRWIMVKYPNRATGWQVVMDL
jgi:hypothetical protein